MQTEQKLDGFSHKTQAPKENSELPEARRGKEGPSPRSIKRSKEFFDLRIYEQ